MARPKSDSLGGLGVWFEIAKAITAETFALGGTEEDVRRILKDKKLAKDIAKLLIGARPGVQSEPAKLKSLLAGAVVKTVHLVPYQVSSLTEAIRLGKYNSHDGDIVTLFAEDELGLDKAVNVDLVEFDRDPSVDEVLAWGVLNGKKPIEGKHLHAIGIQCPDEQRNAPVVELGSARRGYVLYLRGYSVWRGLCRCTVEGCWSRVCRFGFLSE